MCAMGQLTAGRWAPETDPVVNNTSAATCDVCGDVLKRFGGQIVRMSSAANFEVFGFQKHKDLMSGYYIVCVSVCVGGGTERLYCDHISEVKFMRSTLFVCTCTNVGGSPSDVGVFHPSSVGGALPPPALLTVTSSSPPCPLPC